MKIRKWLRRCGWIAAGIVGLLGLAWALLQTPIARSLLAASIAEAVSTSTSKVEFDGLDGWLPGAPRVRRITIADQKGIWMVLDGVAMDWHPVRLLWGEVQVDKLSVKQARWIRKPVTAGASGEGPSLAIPSIALSRFQVSEIIVEPLVAGVGAHLQIDGTVDTRDAAARAVLDFDLRQTDGQARLVGNIDWNPSANALNVSIRGADAPGGIFTRLAGAPTDAALSLALTSSGPLDNWSANIEGNLGTSVISSGSARIRKEGRWHRMEAKLKARMQDMGPDRLQQWLSGEWRLDLDAARSDGGAIRLDNLQLVSPGARLEAKTKDDRPNAPLHISATVEEASWGPLKIDMRATPTQDWSEVDGTVQFEGAASAAAAAVSFKGALTPETVQSTLLLQPIDLQSLKLGSGKATASARLEYFRPTGAVVLEGEGALEGLALPDPLANNLVGSRADISFELRRDGAGKIEPANIAFAASRLRLSASAKSLPAGLAFSVKGNAGDKPVAAGATIADSADGTTSIRNASLSLGSVRLSGDMIYTPSGLKGLLGLEAANLSDISSFIDAELEGPASGTIELLSRSGRQAARVELVTPRVRIDTVRFDELQVRGFLNDLMGTFNLDLQATCRKVDADGFVADGLSATAKGPLADIVFVADAGHEGGQLSAQGRLKIDRSPIRISLATLSLGRDGREMRLAAPTTTTIAGGRVDLQSVRLVAGAGTIRLDGWVGREMALNVEPQALPVWAVGLFTGPVPFAGNLSGRISLRGRARDRISDFDLTLNAISANNASGISMREVSLTARGSTERSGIDIKSVLAGPRGARLNAAGRLPFTDSGTLALDIDGQIDLAMANAWLGASGERAGGRLTLAAKASGQLASPRLAGTGQLVDGFFRSAAIGLEIRGIEAKLEGSEKRVRLSTLSGTTPAGGGVSAEGNVLLDYAAGFPVDLRVQARSARLVSTSLTTMTADMDARMNGALLQSPLISGTVDIRRWDIRIPERLARSLRPIKVTHRNVPPGLVTDDDLTEPEWGSALPFRLDVAVRAPREVFVRGQGVDAEFGGAANLGGTVDAPVVRGAFDLRRGAVTLLSQRIILSRGDIQFVGDTQPMLDIAGSVSKNGVAATVSVKGRAGDPQIVLSSAPSLPQDEILSRLLFSKRTTQLSPFEAAQLAQLIGRWSGLDTGPDILERLRTAIGLDALTATTDEAGTTSVSAGSYVGRGVYIGASEAAGGSATVDVDITENIKLRGEAGTAGTKVGVAAEWEY